MLPYLEVKVLDINSEQEGVPIDALMENAGRAAAETISKEITGRRRIAFVCGVGNNAGDGFVAARYLMSSQDITVLLANPPGDIRTESARRNYERVKHLASASVGVDFSRFDVVVDALLGTGTFKEVREPYKTLISRINESGAFIVSIDIPSGLNTATAVKPNLTVTFTDVKEGMTPENSGKIVVQKIGIPWEAETYIGPGEFVYYPTRDKDSYKGQNGRILIIGGGPFTGAPALAGLAAYRTGVDLVHIATPASSFIPLASYSPNLIVHKLSADVLRPEDLPYLISLLREVDAVLIGPGLGRKETTLEAAREFVEKCDLPLVIDADAITAVGKDLSVLEGKRVVVTPHKGEFKVLTGREVPSKDYEARVPVVEEEASRLKVTILLKGRVDVVSNGQKTKLNLTGNAGMSVGGTGDVLAGEVVALLSRQVEPYNAARIAAFTNGWAGDLAFEKEGYSLMATDVIEQIPQVIKRSLKRIS